MIPTFIGKGDIQTCKHDSYYKMVDMKIEQRMNVAKTKIFR